MSKHTAKPWTAGVDCFVRNSDGDRVASTNCTGKIRYEEQLANGVLMAAAPELLEACKTLHDALSDIVEGENNTFGSYELCNADRDASMAAFDLSFAAIAKAEGATQ